MEAELKAFDALGVMQHDLTPEQINRGARRGAHVDPLAVDVDRLVERRDFLRVLRLAGAARDRAQLVLAVELHAARVAAAAEGAPPPSTPAPLLLPKPPHPIPGSNN